MEVTEKIKRFAELVEKQEKDALIRLCGSIVGNETSYLAHIVPKRKYVYVDVGSSGRYIIEGEKVFGCKAYGVIHRGHFYGDLDDILNRQSVARYIRLN